jgi:hypothetical protein
MAKIKIRDVAAALLMLDNGKIVDDLNAVLLDALAASEAHRAGRKKTPVSGSITLKIKFNSEDGGVTIDVDIASEEPRKVRGSTYPFVDGEGAPEISA